MGQKNNLKDSLEETVLKEADFVGEEIKRKEDLAPNKQHALLWFALELLFKLLRKVLTKK